MIELLDLRLHRVVISLYYGDELIMEKINTVFKADYEKMKADREERRAEEKAFQEKLMDIFGANQGEMKAHPEQFGGKSRRNSLRRSIKVPQGTGRSETCRTIEEAAWGPKYGRGAPPEAKGEDPVKLWIPDATGRRRNEDDDPPCKSGIAQGKRHHQKPDQ
jgi:hypothetical protein